MKTISILLAIIGLTFFQFIGNIGNYFRRRLSSQRGSSQTEGNYLNDILKFEDANNLSREVVTILSGESLLLGQVLGKIKLGTCPTTGTADSGNTGAGTMTGVTAGAKAKKGIYTVKCTHVVSSSGVFSVEDPDGYALPDAVVGAYVSDQINFTLNDGEPDFIVGDKFTVTIASGSLKCVGIDNTAVNGSQDAYGVLIADCDATDADTKAVAIVRNARVVEANLIWLGSSPEMSVLEIAAAMAQLAEKNIVSVTEV